MQCVNCLVTLEVSSVAPTNHPYLGLFVDSADQPTVTGELCVFPFNIGWVYTYYGCTTKDDTALWCETATGTAYCIYGSVWLILLAGKWVAQCLKNCKN